MLNPKKRKSRFIVIFCFFFLAPIGIFAQNWNPFPFKFAYYGKRFNYETYNEAQRPYTTGWLIDALYLDDSIVSGDTLIRNRSVKYYSPELQEYPDYLGPDKPFIGRSALFESQTTRECKLITYLPAISTRYFPNMVKPGISPMEGGGVVDSILAESVFGIMDSVAYLSGGVKWGKSFGILQFPSDSVEGIRLMGVGDLSLGWKNNIGKIKDPKPGDEFHFWKSETGAYACTTQFGPYGAGVNENKWLRMKVLSVGSGFHPLYQVIESEPGAPTGIIYNKYISNFEGGSFPPYGNMGNDSIYPIGVWGWGDNFFSTIGFASDSGQNFVVKKNHGVDLDHLKSYFVSCSAAPLSYFFDYYPLLWVPGFCEGSISVFDYPVYTKVLNQCTFGTPFPNVVITENKGLIIDEELLYPIPNPAKNEFRFSNGAGGSYEIYDGFGRKMLAGIISENPIYTKELPSGVFYYVVNFNGKLLRGKLIRE